ncbi:alpha-kinase family protein [Nitzschia inconspicua]|uniref:Alpha-kinase family protein n=1 Tax=Nitzschia inconspicua TaxID=303405 RepID=A0A9K3M129_9STRA|nr:alpha-kinase family protein [Nitzschia inconspicua]
MTDDKTSLITILSSDHGRLRREQRDIRKRDLQKALKYGSRQLSWGQRYMIKYDGIVFITDKTCRKEVTAFPAPMDLAPVDDKSYTEHEGAKEVIEKKPEMCSSHTVLVIDTSGSMKTHDIKLHRDRQVAAFTTVALEYVAEQLFNESANNRDVVSLIEFNNRAQIVFEREPVSWILFNKLLKRRDIEKRFVDREYGRVTDSIHYDSNYLPALEEAEKILQKGFHDDCALSLFFISDGSPTDAGHLGITPMAAGRMMKEKVSAIAVRFVDHINMSFVGFGNSYLDFSSLESICKAANEAAGIELATFFYCDKLAHSVGTAVTSLASSTMLTKTALMTGGRLTKKNMRTDIISEANTDASQWDFFLIIGHYAYHPETEDFVPFGGLPPGAFTEENREEVQTMIKCNAYPPWLALNKAHCGTGAERVAFRCQLADGPTSMKFRLGHLVAKETLRTDRIDELISFHKSFCETQSLAAHLANQFNKRLRGLPNYSRETTPRVSFLKCTVLLLDDPQWPGGERGVLVEKQLDTVKFGWRKWNNNFGGVDGQIMHRPMDVTYELAQLHVPPTEMIEEESELDSDEDDDEDLFETSSKSSDSIMDTCSEDQFSPSDYLQAFSHFTYLFTNKRLLVCDLQGVYNTDMVPPTFELSDPAIHYRSKSKGSEKTMVYGRTDRGHSGITKFFNTHKCTDICKILQLSQKKQKWRKEWHRNFTEDMKNNFGF